MSKLNFRKIPWIVMVFLVLGGSKYVQACPEGQYEQCVFGACVCLPTSGTVIKQVGQTLNPTPNILETVQGAVNGNIQELSKGIGGLLIKSNCPSCDVLGQNIMDEQSKKTVEEVVGRGFLLFVGGQGDNPVLIVADPATSSVRKLLLKPPEQHLPLSKAPSPSAAKVKRGRKTYSVNEALCAVSQKSTLTAGWLDPPVLTESGTAHTYPTVDLLPGDILVGSSSAECTKVPKGQSIEKQFKIVYDFPSTQPGTPTSMKYFLIGKKVQ